MIRNPGPDHYLGGAPAAPQLPAPQPVVEDNSEEAAERRKQQQQDLRQRRGSAAAALTGGKGLGEADANVEQTTGQAAQKDTLG